MLPDKSQWNQPLCCILLDKCTKYITFLYPAFTLHDIHLAIYHTATEHHMASQKYMNTYKIDFSVLSIQPLSILISMH